MNKIEYSITIYAIKKLTSLILFIKEAKNLNILNLWHLFKIYLI